jgi:hypothetical protein
MEIMILILYSKAFYLDQHFNSSIDNAVNWTSLLGPENLLTPIAAIPQTCGSSRIQVSSAFAQSLSRLHLRHAYIYRSFPYEVSNNFRMPAGISDPESPIQIQTTSPNFPP